MARHRIAVARQTPEHLREALLVEVRHIQVAEEAMSVVDSLRIYDYEKDFCDYLSRSRIGSGGAGTK